MMPLLPPLSTLQEALSEAPTAASPPFEDWLEGMYIMIKHKFQEEHLESGNPPRTPSLCSSSSSESSEDMYGATINNPLLTTCLLEKLLQNMGQQAGAFATLFPRKEHTPHVLSQDLCDTAKIFNMILMSKLDGERPRLDDGRANYLAWKTFVYTIHVYENVQRESGCPLFENSNRQQQCLGNLIQLGAILTSVSCPNVAASQALELLCLIFESDPDGQGILDWDTFGVLLPLTMTLPAVFPKSFPPPLPLEDTQNHNLLKLLFIVNIIKAVITFESSPEEDRNVKGKDEDGLLPLVKIMKIARSAAGLAADSDNTPSAHQMWDHVRFASVPFLRCCALFYHFLTGVPAPIHLSQVNGDTYDALCTFLDLPLQIGDLLGSPLVAELTQMWCQHPKVKWYINNGFLSRVKLHGPVNKLIPLPDDYNDLVLRASTFRCPSNTDEEISNVSICLVCGELMCTKCFSCMKDINNSPVGSGSYHVHVCGLGAGLLLRIQSCDIILMDAPGHGVLAPAPYIDCFGETDQGLRRDNPLTLCHERYNFLNSLWLNHGISREIAKYLEANYPGITEEY